MFWYVVMWQTTEDGDKSWDKIEEIYKNPLNYDIDVRKLSTWVGKEREEEYVIDLMTTNGKMAVDIIANAVKKGELVPV